MEIYNRTSNNTHEGHAATGDLFPAWVLSFLLGASGLFASGGYAHRHNEC
jgi:hypothetical protein